MSVYGNLIVTLNYWLSITDCRLASLHYVTRSNRRPVVTHLTQEIYRLSGEQNLNDKSPI